MAEFLTAYFRIPTYFLLQPSSNLKDMDVDRCACLQAKPSCLLQIKTYSLFSEKVEMNIVLEVISLFSKGRFTVQGCQCTISCKMSQQPLQHQSLTHYPEIIWKYPEHHKRCFMHPLHCTRIIDAPERCVFHCLCLLGTAIIFPFL